MGGCSEVLAEELAPENVCLTLSEPETLIKPQIPFSWGYFVWYRIGVAAAFTAWCVSDILLESEKFYNYNHALWFIFATNWSFLSLAVVTCVQAVLTTYYYARSKDLEEGEPLFVATPVALSIQWGLYNVAAAAALMVSISYWTYLTAFDHSDYLVTPMSKIKHSLNAVYIIVDLAISATPVRIFHVIYPLFVGAIYTVFNAWYFINDGLGPNGKHYAYNSMDWRDPISTAVTCSAGFILTAINQIVLFLLYRLRLWIYKCVKGHLKCLKRNNLEVTTLTTHGDFRDVEMTHLIGP